MNTIGIIPARYASNRFPGKPLVMIGKKTMIERVYRQAKKVLDTVVVATDNESIHRETTKFGGNCIITQKNHKTGTDRCVEALERFERSKNISFDIVINIQCDEPFIDPLQIKQLINCFEDRRTEIATLVKRVRSSEPLFDPNIVKVVMNTKYESLYFSRTSIPYIRNAEMKTWHKRHTFYKHLGIYGYQSTILREITQILPSSLELAESLEQNRWIEHGYTIKCAITETENIGIDTPEDIQKIYDAGLLKDE